MVAFYGQYLPFINYSFFFFQNLAATSSSLSHHSLLHIAPSPSPFQYQQIIIRYYIHQHLIINSTSLYIHPLQHLTNPIPYHKKSPHPALSPSTLKIIVIFTPTYTPHEESPLNYYNLYHY